MFATYWRRSYLWIGRNPACVLFALLPVLELFVVWILAGLPPQKQLLICFILPIPFMIMGIWMEFMDLSSLYETERRMRHYRRIWRWAGAAVVLFIAAVTMGCLYGI